MPLGPGSRVGPYEIVAALGAGGMGEVYRARDVRLKRDVALKFLPDAVAADPERLARFEREAQALAALKHPHIAAIHGIEESGGVRALVLELAEGQTLAGHMAGGALPAGEAIAIARQIVDALEAAHEQGIVHRDLKPANIQIAPDGTVKILDFGLARIVGPDAGAPAGDTRLDSLSPTLTSPALVTGQHAFMGTAAYMSPEQARGKPVDKRADIWAFGVVLFEMLSGTRAFPGETITEVAGAVIHKELDLGALPASTPESVRLVLRRCLQKDPKQRWRDMGDVRLALDGAFTAQAGEQPRPAASGSRVVAAASAAALLAAALAAATVWFVVRREPAALSPIRVDVTAPSVGPLERLALALSPDARHLAFVMPDAGGELRLAVYSFEDAQTQIVAPQEPVRFTPLWSPDSRALVFLSEGGLKKVALGGGAVQTLTDLRSYSGGCWLTEDAVLVASATGFVRVPSAGGVPVPVTAIDNSRGELYHAGATALPDGRHFLYLRGSKDPAAQGVYVGLADASPENQSTTRLMQLSSLPVYAADAAAGSGHLLFVQDGVLMSQGFDPDELKLIGGPVRMPVADRVFAADIFPGVSASAGGAIAFRRATTETASVVWVGRDGKKSGSVATGLTGAEHPRLSPDGRSLALIVARELWKYDVDGRPPVKLTFTGALSPVWSRDGRHIVYEGAGGETLRAVLADGSSKPEDIAPKGHFHPHAFSADSREVVAFQMAQGGGGGSLVRINLGSGAAPLPIVSGGFFAALSPDGRWLAYTSETTGSQEIWVHPYPGPGAPIRVSPNGGTEPLWSRNGKELYYLRDETMMAVAVDSTSGFNFKPAVPLFETAFLRSNQPPSYDVTPDGRFIMLVSTSKSHEPITVIFNPVFSDARAR